MNLKSRILLLALLLLFPRLFLQAAEIYVSPEKGRFRVGETIKVELRLSSKELVNAFELAMFYPPEKLKLLKINEKKSLINLWIQKPSASPKEGKIFFTGGKIGGFNGDGLLTEVIFQAKKSGKAYLTFSPESLVLRHDGLGTPEPTNFLAGEFNLR